MTWLLTGLTVLLTLGVVVLWRGFSSVTRRLDTAIAQQSLIISHLAALEHLASADALAQAERRAMVDRYRGMGRALLADRLAARLEKPHDTSGN